MPQRSFGARARLVAAGAAVALLGALAAVMAATDGSRSATPTPSVSSAPVAHTVTGAS